MCHGINTGPPGNIRIIVPCAEVEQAEVHAGDVLLEDGVICRRRCGSREVHYGSDLRAVNEIGVCHRAAHGANPPRQVKNIAPDIQTVAGVEGEISRGIAGVTECPRILGAPLEISAPDAVQ